MLDIRQVLERTGLSLDRSVDFFAHTLYLADYCYYDKKQCKKFAKYILLPCDAKFWREYVAKSSSLIWEEIQTIYFNQRNDLCWNIYLAVIMEPDEYASLNEEEKQEFLKNTEFVRTLLVQEDHFFQTIPIGRFMDMAAIESSADPLADWMNALAKDGFDFCLDEFQKKRLDEYLDTGAMPTPRQVIRRTSVRSKPIQSAQQLLIPKEFRPHCYQNDWKLDFPLVCLLSGPNGAGKTSILEAIELAMTGSIQRPCGTITSRDILDRPVKIKALTKTGDMVLLSSDDDTSQLKDRERAWYGRQFDPRARLALADSFHNYNQFTVEDTYDFCYGKQPDYASCFSHALFGNEAKSTQNHWKRYMEEAQSYANMDDGETKLSTQLEELRKERSLDASVLQEYLRNSALKFDVTESDWPEKVLKDVAALAAHCDAIRDEIDHLPSKGVASEELLRLRSAQESLSQQIEEVSQQKAEVQSTTSLTQEEMRKQCKEMQEIDAALQRLRQFGPFSELLQYLNQHPAFLENYQDALADYRTCSEQLSRWNYLHASFPDLPATQYLEATLQNAANQLKVSLEQYPDVQKDLEMRQGQVQLEQKQANALETVCAAIHADGQQFLKLVDDPKTCPLCGNPARGDSIAAHLYKSEDNQNAKLSEALRLQRLAQERLKQLNTKISEERECTHIWKEYLDADIAAKESGLYSILLEEQLSCKQRVDYLFHLSSTFTESVRTAEGRLNQMWGNLALGQQLGDRDTFYAKCKQETQRLYETLCEFDFVPPGKTPDQLLKTVETATIEMQSRQNKVASLKTALNSKLQQKRTELLELDETHERLNMKIKEIEAEHSRLERSQMFWTAAQPYLLPEAVEQGVTTWINQLATIRQMAERVILTAQRNTQIKRLEQQLSQLKVRRVRSQKLLDTLQTLRPLEDYAQEFIEKNIQEISKIFLHLHAPQEYSQLVLEGAGDNEQVLTAYRTDGRKAQLYEMSTGQRTAVALSAFLGLHLSQENAPHLLLIDEPVSNIDDLNVLSMMDFLRELAITHKRQIVFTTANQNVARLFRRKFSFLEKEFAEFACTRKTGGQIAITEIRYNQEHVVSKSEIEQ